ncbi:MAG: endolytic transglycosylase MltG, partial [Gemmatimonadales bacterium]
APSQRGRVQEVIVPAGASVTAVAETLEARGIVASADLFRFYARISGRARAIQAGSYRLTPGLSSRETIEQLLKGRPAERLLVVPEGLMLTELAGLVEDRLAIPRDSFLAAASDSALLARLGITAPTLEGYLYPSTYSVPVGATARAVVRLMIAEFDAAWRTEWDGRLDSLGMTRHQIVTLASIIEGEVRRDSDRRYVSSVYHNRLRQGMKLQADPTVIYAIGRRRRLFERDYLVSSPYNTYLIDGLPPGPIGQPSRASIEAALYPERTDFLFLVARPDGQHVFSRTLAEHRRAVREIRRLGGPQGTRTR